MAQHITSVNDLYERTQAMGYVAQVCVFMPIAGIRNGYFSQSWETYIRSSYLCVQ